MWDLDTVLVFSFLANIGFNCSDFIPLGSSSLIVNDQLQRESLNSQQVWKTIKHDENLHRMVSFSVLS